MHEERDKKDENKKSKRENVQLNVDLEIRRDVEGNDEEKCRNKSQKRKRA